MTNSFEKEIDTHKPELTKTNPDICDSFKIWKNLIKKSHSELFFRINLVTLKK